MSHETARQWIQALDLKPHPEGGYYAETYRSPLVLPANSLPVGFGGPRACLTSIHFLLLPGVVSRFHRIRSDELWYFHAGGPVTLHLLEKESGHSTVSLGLDVAAGQRPQAMVPAGCWFGATFDGPGDFALVGCAVAPGFSFADFELAGADRLEAEFPGHEGIIRRLCGTP
jgi:hypothetical protein